MLDQNLILLLGILFVIIGFIVLLFGLISGKGIVEKNAEAGGVIIIGPIPIVFGSTQRITIVLLILAIILVIVLLLFHIVLLYGPINK